MDTHASFLVRAATADDADEFAAHRRALFREVYSVDSAAAENELDSATRRAFRSGHARGACLAWLAVHANGEAIGSCALYLVDRLPSPPNPSAVEGYLAHLYVNSTSRRSGVGSALVRAAVQAAAERGLGRIRLHATEPGRALYESLGFRLRTNDMERRV